jgi:hypothetical protein
MASIRSGFWYYLYIFNIIYVTVNLVKVLILFGLNWYFEFEFDEIQGGYFLQLTWIIGACLTFAIMYSWAQDTEAFSRTGSTQTRLKKLA